MRKWSDYIRTVGGEPEIFSLVREGNVQRLLLYLARSGDPNLCNHKGHSLLMLAAYNGHEILTQQLLRFGADVHARDQAGSTILMGVAFKGHVEIARLLIAAGADIEALNNQGQSARLYAEAFGREDVLKLLNSHLSSEAANEGKILRRLKAFFQIIKSPFKGELRHEH
ncbi:MAG: ankyrin repeat domain-containing protein [Bdellovibrio sp.]|nr:ankyrin repeat domain-containing protein [Bdellovibrio sp.]